MNEKILATMRIGKLYEQLRKKDIVSDETFDVLKQSAAIEAIIRNAETQAQDPEEDFSKNKVSRIIGQAAFLRVYLDGSEEDINKFIAEKGWKQGAGIDELALRALAFCLPSSRSGEVRVQLGSIDLQPEDYLDLGDTIDSTTALPSYKGQLLLLLGRVKAPPGTDQKTVDVARQQAAARLRHDIGRYPQDESTDVRVKVGIDYLSELLGDRLDEVITIDALALKESFLSDDYDQEMERNRRTLETAIAYAIRELYPRH
jgi:hypothetical protein